jgi:hypothetical protein
MKAILIVLSFFLLAAGNKAPRFKKIFNGKDLTGWTIHGTEKWYVDNSELVCESGPDKQYGYLSTDKSYHNFILDLKFKLEANGNSGVYESYGRGWLIQPAPEGEKMLRASDWNHLKIQVINDEVTTWLNGQQIVNLKDEKIGQGKGFIALQIHDGGGIKVRWKNIRIKELK